MKTQWTMIYWQSDTCWLGKLLEHPEIITLGETLEELEENLKEAHLLRILADVPDGYQTKTIRCEIPTRKTLSIPGVGDQVRPGEMTLNEAERASQEGLTMQNSGADTVYTALRKLDGVDDQLLDRPEIAHLASTLEGDETPECVATNGQLSITVATDRRVIDIEQAIWSNSNQEGRIVFICRHSADRSGQGVECTLLGDRDFRGDAQSHSRQKRRASPSPNS